MFWKRLCLCLCLFFCHLTANEANIVFVHLGPKIPPYAEHALLQARQFNPDTPIYLIAEENALKDFQVRDANAHITYITCESLPKKPLHKRYIERTLWKEPFWRYACERFLYLYDLIHHLQLKNVFHLENDVLLYVDVNKLVPVMKSRYGGIAAPFRNDTSAIPALVFIPNKYAMRELALCFAKLAGGKREQGAWGSDWNDMEILAYLRNEKGTHLLDMLPVTIETYHARNPLVSLRGDIAKDPSAYYKNAAAFGGVFDAAALGQFLGGEDPIHNPNSTSFLNRDTVFNASLFKYLWEEDSLGRKVPYLVFEDQKVPIFNLHIHSKRLYLFTSKPF